jgi:chitosanase
MIPPEVKKKIQDIVSVFETSGTSPKYDALVCLHDGPGGFAQITYGKHQTTEYSNLRTLLKMYCDGGGRYASDIISYLQFVGRSDKPLAANESFKAILKRAGADQIMHEIQDRFFDQYYWNPALNFFVANQFTMPLSMAVIYDSYIHSGGIPQWLRDDFSEKTPLAGGHENVWITGYVNARDQWLENHSKKILRNTDYRTDCWKEQIAAGNWDLSKPVVCKFNSANTKDWITIP